ncbi:MAG: hypothetical protein KAT69_10755 [Candidatus Aminicenantes bacterium]|jgi:uncharacterized membrane protein YvbJ|nr:hypothetical protein [Candidatus Aminicenantes bacterium]
MKICPHCSSKIPEDKISCPQCGKEYWVPEMPEKKGGEEDQEEDTSGCLQVVLLPLIVALLTVSFLISCGILVNLFANFESNQVKIAWLLGSVLVGLAVYFLLTKSKKQTRHDR